MAKKKCIYCKAEIDADSVVDMCIPCMHGVWGPRMTEAIVTRMQEEKAKGNLELGEVSGKFSSTSSFN
jgi:hypothetical protein